MADGLSLVLWSLAEYFNYFSVTLIILCSALMTAFIVRINNGEHWGNYHSGPSQSGSSLAYERDVTEFTNPFFLTLSQTDASNLPGRLVLELSCVLPCEVNVYWGTDIIQLHAALLKIGTGFWEDIHNGVLLKDASLATETYSLDSVGKHLLHLDVSDVIQGESLGPAPRQRYPCVVTMTATDMSCVIDHTSVVAVVTVVHVQDDHSDVKSYIIAQYVKMAAQALYKLQPLFLASDSDGDGSIADTQTSHQTCQLDKDESQPTTEEHQAYSLEGAQRTENIRSSCGSPQESVTDITSGVCSQTVESIGAYSNNDNRDVDIGQASFSFQSQRLRSQTVLPDCVVCQSQPLNYVLLPCRHTCVCQVCFPKLDRCPMCRSHIESFFALTDDVSVVSELDEPVQVDLFSRFERFNHRLNRLLGFE